MSAARIRAWAMANGVDPASVTATCDGARIIEINGSRGYAEQAMALPQAAVDAAQAALDSEAPQTQDIQLGKAVLRTYADGTVELISGPLVIVGTTNGAYELWVDSETGIVLSTLDHASPRKSKAEKDADKKAKKDKLAAIKAEPNINRKLEMLLEVLNLKTP